MSHDAVHVLVYVILIGLLLGALFVGAFFVINYGLMSKRPDDERGEHEPSDLHLFQGQIGNDPYKVRTLPAEENDVGVVVEMRERRKEQKPTG